MTEVEDDDHDLNFMDLPVEMKTEVLERLPLSDLWVSRAVAYQWDLMISRIPKFKERTILTICNDESLRIFQNSQLNWSNLQFVRIDTLTSTVLQQILPDPDQRLQKVQTLTLSKVKFHTSRLFLSFLLAFLNLKVLTLEEVRFLDRTDPFLNPQEREGLKVIGSTLKALHLQLLHYKEVLFLYQNFGLMTQSLTQFHLKEVTEVRGIYDDDDETVLRETLNQYLDQTRDILLQSSKTLKGLTLAFAHPEITLKFYSLHFPQLVQNLQLETLAFYLGHPLDGQRQFWEYFELFEEEEMLLQGDPDTTMTPTELFNGWRSFLERQTTLKSLRIPHYDLNPEVHPPFDSTHFPAYQQLINGIPSSVRSLDGPIFLAPMKGQGQGHLASQLQSLKGNLNLSFLESESVEAAHFRAGLETLGKDPDKPFPKLKKVQFDLCRVRKRRRNLWSSPIVNPPKIYGLLFDLLPGYHLREIDLNGNGIDMDGDVILQGLIPKFPTLEVLRLNQCSTVTDYGLTGISKKWLVKLISSIDHEESPDRFVQIMEDEVDPDLEDEYGGDETQIIGLGPKFLGRSLSDLGRLQVISIPKLRKLTDIGIFYGLMLPNLKEFVVCHTCPNNKISDFGLESLTKNCPNLERIQMTVGDMTSLKGFIDLRNSLPRLKNALCNLNRVVQKKYGPNSLD